MAKKPYRDPKTTKIEDWKWRPLEQVKAELGDLREVPDYIQGGFGQFMNEQAGRAKRGEMSPRDLIKAYTIAQSSIGRGGLSHATATKTGMRLPNTGGEVRPEGAFAEWLGSPEGQRYLDLAERGQADMSAIGDLQGKFAPFGKHNDQAEKMVLAAKLGQSMGPGLNAALTGSADDYRDYAEQMKGIAGAKSGFIGSLLGRGDLPTLDARQLNLHALPAAVGIGSIMNRGKGKGAREAVDRLSARQRAMALQLDPSLMDHYQHLAHHAVWDKTANAQTTHEDLIRAMRGYAKGGDVEPTTEQMRQMLAQSGHIEHTPQKPHAAVGQRYDVDQAYGLAPKNDVDLEQHKGASVMVMPWDSTSRNVRVRGISGHELPEHVTTHGGQDYARDLGHILQGVAGASGEEIAKRIATREAIARMENEKQGGTGRLLHMPITMGERGEDFAMTPTEILHQLVMRGMLPPEELARMNAEIRAHKIEKSGKRIQPFGGFVGLEHPEFDQQIVTGKGLDTTAGELRKAIVNRVGYLKHNQKALDFNIEDLVNAVTDPALRGVPKGYIGNTVIGSDPDHMTLTPSSNKAYDTNFSGQYLGTLGHSFPAEILFGNKMAELRKEFEGKKADPRTMALGALEKRNDNISQILDNETLDRYGKYLMERDRKLRTGHYADGGEVKAEPSQDEMLAHVMLKGMPNLKDIGANEAPNMHVKTYVPAGPGKNLPVGGVDFQPEQPGQQVLPGQPQQSPGQPGQSPGQPGQSPAPQGQPPMTPQGQRPQQPPSNILQMTPQGQALAAMRPPPQPQVKMAEGGSIKELEEYIRQHKGGYGARRVQRAADEIPNLEDLYTLEALKHAFSGDNAQAMMTMNPAHFEQYASPISERTKRWPGEESNKENLPTADYIRHLQSVGRFHDVPMLELNKEEAGLPLTPFISGHEGRHRSRAMAQAGQQKGLVRMLPRSELREPFPRRSQEDYIEAMKKELAMTKGLVLPQRYSESKDEGWTETPVRRPAIKMPDIYAKGGTVKDYIKITERKL